jgi:hypothetical protein
MKTILILSVVLLIAVPVVLWRGFRMPDEFGEFTGAPKASVSDLIDEPARFLHKTVTIEGEVRNQCTTMGCYFFFLSGDKMLRVDLASIAMNAPRRNGHVARVEGQIMPYGDGYQFIASAVQFQ